jgi:dephospho-CoA kinase
VRPPYVVGVGGQAGAGKSEFVKWLRGRDIRVIDADRIGWALLRSNTPSGAAVKRAFCPEVLGAGREIDRGRLGKIVFASAAARRRLNRIVHPALLRRLRRQAWSRSGPRVRVIDAALLFYWGLESEVDLAILVRARREVKLQRLIKTGLTRSAAAARLRSQPGEQEMARRADLVIANNGTRQDLRRQARAVRRLLPV